MPFDPISFSEARKKEDAPLASAVVYKKNGKIIARLYDENREKWRRIAQGQAGVDDAQVIQQAVNAIGDKGGVIVFKKAKEREVVSLGLRRYEEVMRDDA